jgi:exonuclease SbcC
MRLLALELENWAVHGRLKLEVDRSLQIEGRNGTGKSSILAAIRFVFAKDGRNYKKYIKNGTRSCKVTLKFSDKGSEYLVEKSLHLKTPSEAKMLAGSRLVASNPTEVYARLQDLLPENILEKLLYVPQDGLIELIENLRIKGGRQELDALLGLDKFERIYAAAGVELREKEARHQEVSDRLKKYSPETEAECKEQIKELEGEDAKLHEGIEKDKEALKNIDSAIAGVESGLGEMRAKKKEKDAAEKKVTDLRLCAAEDAKELEALEDNLKSLAWKKDHLKELSGKEIRLKIYPSLREPLTQLIKDEELLKELSDTKKKETKFLALKDELKSLASLKEKESAIEAGISDREKKLAAVESVLSERIEYMRSLQGLDGEAKCPKCGQILTRAHLAKELKIAKTEENRLTKTASNLEDEATILKKSLKELRNDLERLRKTEVDAECLRTELEDKARDKKKTEGKIAALKEKLERAGYDGESVKEVEEKVSELNKLLGEVCTLEKELRREEDYLRKKETLGERMRQTAADIKETEEKAKSLECDDGALDALQKEKERLREGASDLKSKVEVSELKREYNREKRDSLKVRRDEFLELKMRSEALRKEENLLKDALEVFHTNKGIVKYLRERYISQLSSRMSYYFTRINQNPKYREIAFDKDYNIEIKTTEGSFSIEQLSGGEKVQLAIALRIAMIRMLSPINLLILDEPFGSLDREHREVLGEALNKIALDGQLVLVTHIVVDSLNLPEKVELGGY